MSSCQPEVNSILTCKNNMEVKGNNRCSCVVTVFYPATERKQNKGAKCRQIKKANFNMRR